MEEAQKDPQTSEENNLPESAPQQEQRKGRKFPIKLVWFLLVVAIVVVLGGALYFFTQIDFGGEEDPGIENSTPIIRPEDTNPVKTYINDRFKFSVKYNTEKHEFSRIDGSGDQPPQFLITYKGSNQGDIQGERDLVDGYMVKISAFSDIDLGVEELALRKKERYRVECPEVVDIGTNFIRNIDGIEAQSFEVVNCPQNYVENFVRFGDGVIEVTQIYRGDIGFRQSYKAQTEQIVRSIEWLRDPQENPDVTLYKNSDFKFSFVHPFLDSKCCTVTAPSLENVKEVVVMGDVDKENDVGEVLDKFGIFAYPTQDKTLKLFLNEQKQNLVQEFKVVEGRNPSGLSEERVQIGDYEGIKLKNYAWWGEVIYMKHPSLDSFLIFVLPDGITSEFRTILDEIFASFEFDTQM